jgi:hypothetical protein
VAGSHCIKGQVNTFNLAKNAGTSVEQIEHFYARNLPLSKEMAINYKVLEAKIFPEIFNGNAKEVTWLQQDRNSGCLGGAVRGPALQLSLLQTASYARAVAV